MLNKVAQFENTRITTMKSWIIMSPICAQLGIIVINRDEIMGSSAGLCSYKSQESQLELN